MDTNNTQPTAASFATINGVDGRFFLIQPDGSIKSRNDSNKLLQFVFIREATARIHAQRGGARIWDKQYSRFI